MNVYRLLFRVERPFPDDPGYDEEIHHLTFHERFASGWCETLLNPVGTTIQDRARFLLCKSPSGHRFNYLEKSMNEIE